MAIISILEKILTSGLPRERAAHGFNHGAELLCFLEGHCILNAFKELRSNFRERKGEQADTIKDESNAEVRNRKKSIKFKSNKDKPNSRQNSVKSHRTPSPYRVSFYRW